MKDTNINEDSFLVYASIDDEKKPPQIVGDTQSLDGSIEQESTNTQNLDDTPLSTEGEQSGQEEVKVIDASPDKVDEDKSEEKTSTEEVDSGGDLEINPNYLALLNLKNEGVLDDDFEISPEATWQDVEPVLEKKVAARIEQQTQQKFQQMGYDENTLMYARLIAQGQDPAVLSKVNQLGQIASLKNRDDLNTDQKAQVIQNMYNLKNYDPAESNLLIATTQEKSKDAEDGGDFEKLYKKALDFHEQQFLEVKKKEKQQAQEKERAIEQRLRDTESTINRVLNDRKIGDFAFPKDVAQKLRSAIYQKDTEYEYRGQKYRGGGFDAFLAKLDQDVETKIKAYLLLEHYDNIATSEAKKKKINVEEQILKNSKRKIVKKNKKQETDDTDYTLNLASVY